jgi:predicted ATPase
MNEGFICKRGERYEFAHDRIQEAAYGMIQSDLRCHLHLHYGMRLVEVALERNNDIMLFTAVGQINLAGPSFVTDTMQAAEIAEHNLIAGKKAIALSDFSSAASFFDSGVSFLKENHWNHHYNLSLELFEYAVKCSLVLGDHVRLTALSLRLFKHARCLEDRFNTLLLVMSSLAYASKISQSVKAGMSILVKLDQKLPTASTREDIICHIKRTQKLLSTISDVDLINGNKMTDTRHDMAMKCLSKLQLTIFLVSPDLQPVVTLKMVDLTIEHGMSPMSPVGFAYFASLLGQLGELKDALRFAKLSKSLLDAMGSNEILGKMPFQHCVLILVV